MHKRKLERSADYKIVTTRGKSEFVNWKVRIILPSPTSDWEPDVEGYLHNLRGYMLSGKHQGQVVDLPPCKLLAIAEARKCRCPAYKYPHAPGFGLCKDNKFEQVAPTGLVLEELFNGH